MEVIITQRSIFVPIHKELFIHELHRGDVQLFTVGKRIKLWIEDLILDNVQNRFLIVNNDHRLFGIERSVDDNLLRRVERLLHDHLLLAIVRLLNDYLLLAIVWLFNDYLLLAIIWLLDNDFLLIPESVLDDHILRVNWLVDDHSLFVKRLLYNYLLLDVRGLIMTT
jgi:hypothetical protein